MRWIGLAVFLLLAGCTAKPPLGFAESGPAFDPIAFFTGHVTSWGVEENRAGQPTGIVTTDCIGTPTGPDRLTMVQTLHVGGKVQTRIWQLTATAPGHYTATANDMAGNTVADVSGRTMHWRWVLEVSPGSRFETVTMDQWFYRMDDGAVMIRTVVSKLGIRLIEVSEQFHQQK